MARWSLAVALVLTTLSCRSRSSEGEPVQEEVSPSSQAGEPIEAPPLEWTWIDFPDTRCADGSPTGLGVNLSPGADRLLVVLEHGGACWSYSNCFGLVSPVAHLDGFDAEDLYEAVTSGGYSRLFDRETTIPGLRRAHYIFIPYCTADVFTGNSRVELTGTFPWERRWISFTGNLNIRSYLRRLTPTFSDVDRVILAGSSAGGFGALFNIPHFQEAFSPTRVDLLDDSGPLINGGDALWSEWVQKWNPQLPRDCTDCRESFSNVRSYYEENMFSNRRVAYLGYSRDLVVSYFLNIGANKHEEQLNNFIDILDRKESANYFIVDGMLHTLLFSNHQTIRQGGVATLGGWLEAFVSEEESWQSYRP